MFSEASLSLSLSLLPSVDIFGDVREEVVFDAQLDSVYNGARRSGEDSPVSIKWSPSSASLPSLFSSSSFTID
jgi:hypothetical protein